MTKTVKYFLQSIEFGKSLLLQKTTPVILLIVYFVGMWACNYVNPSYEAWIKNGSLFSSIIEAIWDVFSSGVAGNIYAALIIAHAGYVWGGWEALKIWLTKSTKNNSSKPIKPNEVYDIEAIDLEAWYFLTKVPKEEKIRVNLIIWLPTDRRERQLLQGAAETKLVGEWGDNGKLGTLQPLSPQSIGNETREFFKKHFMFSNIAEIQDEGYSKRIIGYNRTTLPFVTEDDSDNFLQTFQPQPLQLKIRRQKDTNTYCHNLILRKINNEIGCLYERLISPDYENKKIS